MTAAHVGRHGGGCLPVGAEVWSKPARMLKYRAFPGSITALPDYLWNFFKNLFSLQILLVIKMHIVGVWG